MLFFALLYIFAAIRKPKDADFVLFDESGYKTNVFEKHLHLPIQTYQFDVWLTCFLETTNNLFIGEKAELAKQRATVLTQTFKSKWQNIKNI